MCLGFYILLRSATAGRKKMYNINRMPGLLKWYIPFQIGRLYATYHEKIMVLSEGMVLCKYRCLFFWGGDLSFRPSEG